MHWILTASLCLLSFLCGALAAVLVYPSLMLWAARGDDEHDPTGGPR
jgi:hypothetical protein